MNARVSKLAAAGAKTMRGGGIRKRATGLARAAAWFALVLLCAGCWRSDPEAALRDSIAGLQSALERRDGAAIRQYLADDFIGNDGLDRDGARRLAAASLLRHREVGVTTGPLGIEMAGGHATVGFTVMLRGGAGRRPPEALRVYDVETGWRFDDGGWKLVSARWKPVL